MSEFNPFAAPADFGDVAKPSGVIYGGIGRLAYFGFSVLAYIALILISSGLRYAFAEDAFPLLLILVVSYYATLLFLVVQRLNNMGYSGWWTLGIIVPFLNLLIGLKCIAAPAGYAFNKRLDTAGNIIAGIFVGIVVLAIITVIVLAALG